MVRHLMYQNFIFLFIFGGGVSFLYCLLHKGNKYRWVSGGIASACAVVIVVYFLPFSVQMPMESAEKLGGVSVYVQGIRVDLTTEQKQELVELCNELKFQRQVGQQNFTYVGEKMAQVVINGVGNHLSVLFSMEKDGFNGNFLLYAVTDKVDRVLNPEAVLNYLYDLVEEQKDKGTVFSPS